MRIDSMYVRLLLARVAFAELWPSGLLMRVAICSDQTDGSRCTAHTRTLYGLPWMGVDRPVA
jgi:hypothetical protein